MCTPNQFLPPMSEFKLEFAPISQGELVSVMRSLQPKTSRNIDGLSIKLLREIAIEISRPLTHIYNLSLSKGTFPEALKTSRIIHIHKSGSTNLCDNYRPIALLISISKTLEKIVAIKLTNHLEIHKLLSPCQFGFQKRTNTEHNLVRIVN